MTIYKYISWRPFHVEYQHDKNCEYIHKCYSKDNLLNSQLYFNSAKSFNDPFDVSPFFDTNATQDQILEKAIEVVGVQEGLTGNSALLRAKELIKLRKINTKEGLDQAVLEQKSLLYRMGVCCFSKAGSNNILMWSHYAEKHTGICLEFYVTSASKPFRTLENPDVHPILSPSPVKYDSDLPQVNLFTNTKEDLYNCLTTKSPEWQYEAEYRSACFDYVGIVLYKPWLLKSVTAGCMMPDREFSELVATINKLKYQPYLYHAIKKARGYGVEMIRIF